MKNFLFLSLILLLVGLSSCDTKKNYSVTVSGNSVNVRMHSPTIGIVGINEVGYDGFTYEDVDQEIFDKIRDSDYNGDYNVYVTLEFLDDHGNRYAGEPVLVTTLNGADVKSYASYSYFRGNSHIENAYPWNHNYY